MCQIKWFTCALTPVAHQFAQKTSATEGDYAHMKSELGIDSAEVAYVCNRNGDRLLLWFDEEGMINDKHLAPDGAKIGFAFPNGLQFAGPFAVTAECDDDGEERPCTQDAFDCLMIDCRPVKWVEAA